MRFFLLLLFILPLLCDFSWADDERIKSLEQRIQELEKNQEELILSASENRTQVNSFLRNNLTFGGFFEPSYTLLSGQDTEFQGTNSANILGINIAADYGSNIRFVSQFLTGLSFRLSNPHNNPDAQPSKRRYDAAQFGAVLAQGYLEYEFNSNYRIQGGTGYVPFGFAHQQRELVLFVRRGGPQFLRTTDFIAPLWSGFNFLANFNDDYDWGYSIHSVTPITSPRHPGAGGRMYWSVQERVTLGLSSQIGKIEDDGFQVLGTDVRINYLPFHFVGEFAQNMIKGEDVWSGYVEPGYYILDEEVLLYVFGDYAYSPRSKASGPTEVSISDSYQKWEYGGGVNWLPTSFTRLRLGLTIHDYTGSSSSIKGQERDFVSLDISAGIAF
jgi:hypothetical protein